MRPSSLSFLLYTVFLQNEASSERLLFSLAMHRLTWALYLAVGGPASVELSGSLTNLALQTRLAPIPRLPILAVWSCSRSLSLLLKLVCCRLEICNISASLHPATELRSARGWASVRSGPCCESSSGPSVLIFAPVLTPQRFLCYLELFLELRHVEESPGCLHSTWDTFFFEHEMQISRRFSMKSHAPCAVKRQCQIPKAVTMSCW